VAHGAAARPYALTLFAQYAWISKGNPYDPGVPAFFLSFQDEGKCVLKEEGIAGTREFDDILAAIEFISLLDVDRNSTLTIYDRFGKLIFDDLLSNRPTGR